MSWLYKSFVVERDITVIEGSESAGGNEQGFLVIVDMTAGELFDPLSEECVGSVLDVVVLGHCLLVVLLYSQWPSNSRTPLLIRCHSLVL